MNTRLIYALFLSLSWNIKKKSKVCMSSLDFSKQVNIVHLYSSRMGFPGGLVVRNLPANVADMGLIPGLERSPGGEHGNPLQYSCLENPMHRGAWWATVNVAIKATCLSTHTCTVFTHN